MRRIHLLVGALLASLLIAGCGGDADDAPRSAQDVLSDPGPVHVHGLGVNPADNALFIATHTGVWRLPEGEKEATRVADRYQDTMGFAVVGPDRFIGSGHPDMREDLPPFLGFIESADAAQSWRQVSLLGEADFHVLEASGARVYGFGSNYQSRSAQLLVSDNRGRDWTRRDFPEPFASLAISPNDPDTAIASGDRRLFLTTDGGRAWKPVDGTPGLLVWAQDGVFRIDQAGSVAASPRPGADWTEVGSIGGAPAAFDSDGGSLFAALHDGSIRQSRGGRDWKLRFTPQ